MEFLVMKDCLVGWTRDGRKIYASAQIKKTDREHTSTTHEVTPVGSNTVSLSGVEIRPRGSFKRDGDWISCGQNALSALKEVVKLADNWTRPEVLSLWDIWDNHHLNDMQAKCAHQDKTTKWDVTPDCPETGYKAGSAWLFSPVPDSVLYSLVGIILHHTEKVSA